MAQIRNPLHLEIIPSPGTQIPDWRTMEEKIEMVLPFAESIHLDLLDGKFAPNTTLLDSKPFAKYAKDITLEVHLMVENPIEYLKPFADAGFTRFIGQIEQMPDIEEFIAQAEMLGEVGLAVDSQTEVARILPYIEGIDFVLVMTVKAGWSNQKFMPDMLEKVGKLRATDPLLPIEIDGGVNDETITPAKDAGATRFVSTGFIYGGENKEENYKKLLSLVSSVE